MFQKKYFPKLLALKVVVIAVVCLSSANVPGLGSLVIHPFQKADAFRPNNKIDTIIMDALTKKDVEPANLCSDEVFIRRIYLDVTGTLPQAEDVRKFLENPRADKRTSLISTLLKKKEFSEYASLKWCDLLRVKAEFPINLWPNAVQAYHRWIQDAIAYNMPYDQFARELLTSSGSNFRVPQVNFYRAIQGHEPSSIANAAALTFMGSRFENWPKEKQKSMATFFSRVSYKGTAEWKEEIVSLDPAPADPLKVVFPDGTTAKIEPGQDPREVFADWLITPENPWFACNIVNRIWSWLLGRGIIHEPDDIRPDNPPVYPELLTYLEKELVESKYDLRHIYTLILNSRTYQQSSIPHPGTADAEKMFACYPVRQLEAEVLIDALCSISGTRESYSSPIPEPFTFIPPEHRTISLADGSITSQFLEMFGRPSRDTGLESERNSQPTEAQRRHMLNSTHIQKKIERGWRLRNLTRRARGNRKKLSDSLYLTILSRYPTESERQAIEDYFKTKGIKANQASIDLTWALINSKEFLYRH
jgi:hypothetical protein